MAGVEAGRLRALEEFNEVAGIGSTLFGGSHLSSEGLFYFFGGTPHHIYHTVILTEFHGVRTPLHLTRQFRDSGLARCRLYVQY